MLQAIQCASKAIHYISLHYVYKHECMCLEISNYNSVMKKKLFEVLLLKIMFHL